MAEPSVVMMAIQRVVPALRITNYERSKKFYLDQLGFILEWEHRFEPTFPVFMSVALDGMRLYLTEHSGDCQVGGLVHFVVSDVDALHDAFKKRQVPITEAPNDDLGFRNMTITDLRAANPQSMVSVGDLRKESYRMVTRFGVPANAMSASSRMKTAKARKEMCRMLVPPLCSAFVTRIGPPYGEQRNLCSTA